MEPFRTLSRILGGSCGFSRAFVGSTPRQLPGRPRTPYRAGEAVLATRGAKRALGSIVGFEWRAKGVRWAFAEPC